MVPLPEQIRIFPLGEVVLFPDTLLPLHIFEPRYRRMLADALEGDRILGMVLLKDPDAEPLPAVYEIGCAGTIVEHKPFADGRSLVVLQGTARFRIRRELETDEPYRIVEAQALYEAPPPPELARSWRDGLRADVRTLMRATSGQAEELDRLFDKVDAAVLPNVLAAGLPLDAVEKQSLLECATVEQRQQRLSALVRFRIAEASLGMDAARPLDA